MSEEEWRRKAEEATKAAGYKLRPLDPETEQMRDRTRKEAYAKWGKKSRPLYEIFIHLPYPSNRPGGRNGRNDKYALSYHKQFGNAMGGACGAETKEEAIQDIKDTIKHWNKPDDMAPSTWKPVSEKNTVFGCYDGSITLLEILQGVKTLDSFFG